MILLYLVAVISFFLLSDSKKLSVTSVSTSDSQQISNTLYGSTQGGTLLYIKGTGFQQNPSKNSVFIGQYPCIIPDEGMKEETMICTTSSIYPKVQAIFLPIVITSNKQKVTAIQTFSYTQNNTPSITQIYPSHSYGSQTVNFVGIHRISDLGDGVKPEKIKGLYIGTERCSRIGVNQKAIISYTTQSIKCIQSESQEAGRYSIKEQVQIGFANKSMNLKKTSLYGDKYEYVVLPTVKQVSPKNGSIAGQQLTIKGTGFPSSNKDKNKVTVTVDNTQCQIVQASANYIRCNLKKKSVDSQKILNPINITTFSYISGSGFKYSLYNYTDVLTNFQIIEQNYPFQLKITESGIKGQIYSSKFSNNAQIQVFEGYFYAPNSGQYTFIGYSKNQFKVYLNPVAGIPSIQKSQHLFINGSLIGGNTNPYSYQGSDQLKSITLQGGKYYYMKIYNQRINSGDYFKIFAEVPNNNKQLSWKAPQLQKVTLNFTNQPFTLRFRSLGAISGIISASLKIVNPDTLAVVFDQSVQLPYNASADMLCGVIQKLQTAYNVSNSNPDCKLNYLDQNLQQLPSTTSQNQIYGYQWIVTYQFPLINSYTRTNIILPAKLFDVTYVNAVPFGGEDPTFTQQKIQDQGPLISGTFKIIVNNSYLNYTAKSIDFPPNLNATEFQVILKKYFNNDKISVIQKDSYPNWKGQYGKSWTIQYNNPQSQFPQFQFITENLTGGADGTTPQIYFQIIKKYSNNLLYSPLSFELMRTVSSKPSVLVKVNNITSVCLSSCSFVYVDDTPQIATMAMNSPLILINLTSEILKNTSNIQIAINNQNACKKIEILSNSSISCTFETNQFGYPLFRAGKYKPHVWIETIGFLEYTSSVSDLNIQFGLMNPLPSNGSVLGGLQINLKGKGLPTQISDLIISLCDVTAQIKKITRTSVTFITPHIIADFPDQTLNCTINVEFASYDQNKIFQAGIFTFQKQPSPPIISSLSKTEANPTKKGILYIYGTGFDKDELNDISSINVNLIGADIDKKYPMRVLSVNDTQIKVGLSGGLTGSYLINVYIKGRGFAKYLTQDSGKFFYINKIFQVSPSDSSYFGGKQISISGSSFSSDILENQVFIGSQICSMVLAQQNELKCITPSKDQSTNDLTYDLYVMSRQISKSVCVGTCQLRYLPVYQSPTITEISQSKINSSNIQVTIYGTNLFKDNLTTILIMIHKTSRAKFTFIPIKVNQTEVTWKTVSLPGGDYYLFAEIQGLGYSNITVITVETIISSVNQSISTQGGILSIVGFGLPLKIDEQPFELQIIDLRSGVLFLPIILKASSELIQIQLPSRKQNDKLKVSIKSSNTQSSQYIVQYLDSQTPKAKIISNLLLPWKDTSQIIISQNTFFIPQSVKATSQLRPNEQVDVEWEHNSTHILIKNHNLDPGTYKLKVYSLNSGYYQINQTISILQSNISDNFKFSSENLSVEGGFIIINHQKDKVPQSFGKHSSIFINGDQTQIQRVNDTSLKVLYQPFVMSDTKITEKLSQSELNLEDQQKLQNIEEIKKKKTKTIDLSNYVKWSDSGNTEMSNTLFDELTKTTYFSSNSQCFVGIYFGKQYEIEISKIRYYPNKTWSKPGDNLVGALFEGSADNITWKKIKTLESKVERGWNKISIKKKERISYRYFRFSHNAQSGCSLGEIQIIGTKISNPIFDSKISNSNTSSDRSVVFSYSDGLNKFQWTNINFTYVDKVTPVIQKVIPRRGNVHGGEIITLTGIDLDGTPSVNIDGQICQIIEHNNTCIKCKTNSRLSTPKQILFEVLIDGKTAITKQHFNYVYRWSDIDTWGVDLPPIEGDLIYIPTNMHLYIDQSTPKLAGIIAENSTLQIADQCDIQINTANLILMGAKLIAGTAQQVFTHKLNFNFYGLQSDNQIPFFGNKGIGCTNCKISLHGLQKQSWTWANSVLKKQNQVTGPLKQPLNWKQGDQLALSSSSFQSLQSQKVIISSIDTTSYNLSLKAKENLQFDHFTTFEQTKVDNVFVGSHIGSLSRNIILQGDQNSDSTEYGIHLTFIGNQDSGLQVKISNIELRNCGQPKKSRHCINFNRNSDLSTSYIKNSTASNTYAKFISISSTNYLTISSNVGYRVKGHNIELKDGTEENNIIENNLMISSLPYYRDLQSDVMVASFYISNPNNIIKNNVAAGGYYYGFLYDLKSKPEDGIYAKDSICTSGYSTAVNKGNIAHSIRKIAVRIKQLYTRQYPCNPSRNNILQDPWQENPSKQSVFSDYIIYKTGQLGLMCDDIGHITFNNFTMIENIKSHIQFHIMNYTRQYVRITNSTFAGISNLSNPPSNIETKGLVLPRSGSINLTNILFKKYIINQTIIQTCSLCDQIEYYTNNGQQYFFQQIQYQNIDKANYLEMLGLQKQIIYDKDGSFTNNIFDNIVRTKATVVKGFHYILDEPGCNKSIDNIIWDDTAICGANITIRKVSFMNIMPFYNVYYYPPLIQRISSNPNQISTVDYISTSIGYNQVQLQIQNSWSSPFVTGTSYKISTDFQLSHVNMQSSHLFEPNDKAIIFKFVYNLTTQLFDVYKLRNLQIGNLINSQLAVLNVSTCKNGDYYHNNTIKQFQVCSSGKNSTLYQLIDITSVYCRYDCPKPPVVIPTPIPTPVPEPTPVPVPTPTPVIVDPNICIREDFVRKWSNTSQWPLSRLPVSGQNVTVHCNWTMQLDINPDPIAQLIIDGKLIVPANRDLINVTAQTIWVRLGSWIFGNQTSPFDKKVIIQLNGQSTDRGYAVDAVYAGRKNLVVSGRLEIYGPQNFDQSTILIEDALVGAQFIKVKSCNNWKIGDEIVLSTSSRSWNQSQKHIIETIDIDGKTIKISPPLLYFHHGSDTPSVDYENNLLITASKVIYLSRNIQIVPGPDQTYGFSVLVYGFLDQNGNYQMGSVYLKGVQFKNGGQGGGFQPVLSFKNTVTSSYSSYIAKCSFNKCNSECVKFNNAKNLIFEKNILYDSVRAHIRSVQLRQAKILSNIMIKTRKDPNSSQNITVCLQNKEMLNTPFDDNLSIILNECYGSEDIGFTLPYLPCNINNNIIFGNIASGCLTGFFMIKLEKQMSKCLICQDIKAFNCKYGVLGNPDQTTNLTYNNLIMTGNQQSLILRFSSKQKNNSANVINSYISAITDPDCSLCTPKAQQCSNAVGIRLLSITQTGSTKSGFNITEIKSSSPIDGKTFIQNVKFTHFRLNYSDYLNLQNCENNFIFKAHRQAIDLIGSTHIYESQMIESQNQSVVYFNAFDINLLGLEGGCGESNCTSLENYFIQDYTGNVLGAKRNKLLPNNQYFSNKTLGCEFISSINGYFCNNTQQVAVLELQSIASDYNTRIIWPINLISYSNDIINNTLNVEKQWTYKNGYPEGKRKARTSSLIKLNNTYNITFYNRAPSDMIFQIQQKSPTIEDFGWVKLVLEYPQENSIRIKANDIDKNPIVLLDNRTQSDPSSDQCGSYKYVYSKKYIEFILTTDCKIRMSFVNSVKASIRLDQAVTDFFTNNGTGKFIDKMCVILGITDTSRLKIVGVYTGSTVVDFYVEEQQTTTEQNATSAPSVNQSSSSVTQINQLLTDAVSSGQVQTALTSAGLGSVLSVSSSIVLVNEAGIFQTDLSGNTIQNDSNSGNLSNNNSQKTIIIIVIVISVVLLIFVLAIVYFKCIRKQNMIENESVIEEIKNELQIISVQKNEVLPQSFFEQRKMINLQNIRKKGKVKKQRQMRMQNNSLVNFKNPFDEYYMPQDSSQQLQDISNEILQKSKFYIK